MASTFHPFPNLPCELRLQIWQLAIRPSRGSGGVHRFNILKIKEGTDNDGAMHTILDQNLITGRRPCHVAAVPKMDNRSAYLWDGGLWTACRESKEVIMKHLKVQSLNELRKTESGIEEEDIVAMVTASQSGQDWHFMVRPYQDLFHLALDDWEWTIDWWDFFCHLPFCSWGRGYSSSLSHIAIEFDPSWNDDFPDYHLPLLMEPTARGFVARAVQEYARGEIQSTIWLIDRSAPPGELDDKLKVFYDCDREYIETDPSGRYCGAALFLHKFQSMGADTCYYDQGENFSDFIACDTSDCIRMLTCRERDSETGVKQ